MYGGDMVCLELVMAGEGVVILSIRMPVNLVRRSGRMCHPHAHAPGHVRIIIS